jgi:hypothetical protein
MGRLEADLTTISDRAHLEPFLAAVDASPTALERPNCRGWVGDYQISGKHGHVLADPPGFLVYVTGTAQRWKKAKRVLPGKTATMRALSASIAYRHQPKPRRSGT